MLTIPAKALKEYAQSLGDSDELIVSIEDCDDGGEEIRVLEFYKIGSKVGVRLYDVEGGEDLLPPKYAQYRQNKAEA